jgi:hypothetical protein
MQQCKKALIVFHKTILTFLPPQDAPNITKSSQNVKNKVDKMKLFYKNPGFTRMTQYLCFKFPFHLNGRFFSAFIKERSPLLKYDRKTTRIRVKTIYVRKTPVAKRHPFFSKVSLPSYLWSDSKRKNPESGAEPQGNHQKDSFVY